MKRNILLFWLFFLLSVARMSAATSDNMVLSLENSEKTVSFHNYAIKAIFTLQSFEKDGTANVLVTLENNDTDGHYMFVFNQPYTVADLQALTPKIYFQKTFPHDKSSVVDYVANQPKWKSVASQHTDQLFTIQIKEDQISFSLPIYVASKKNKSGTKLEIVGHEMCNVMIQVVREDKVLKQIESDYATLKAELDTITFCTNRRHKGWNADTVAYRNRIDALVRQIRISSPSRFDNPRLYDRYNSVYEALMSFRFIDRSLDHCKNDISAPAPGPGHNCRYCDMPSETLYNEIQRLLIRLDSGRISVDEAIRQAEAINTCAKKQKAHREVAAKVKEVYQSIKSYK